MPAPKVQILLLIAAELLLDCDGEAGVLILLRGLPLIL
jgi:hypothetical protein